MRKFSLLLTKRCHLLYIFGTKVMFKIFVSVQCVIFWLELARNGWTTTLVGKMNTFLQQQKNMFKKHFYLFPSCLNVILHLVEKMPWVALQTDPEDILQSALMVKNIRANRNGDLCCCTTYKRIEKEWKSSPVVGRQRHDRAVTVRLGAPMLTSI